MSGGLLNRYSGLTEITIFMRLKLIFLFDYLTTKNYTASDDMAGLLQKVKFNECGHSNLYLETLLWFSTGMIEKTT